MNFCLKIVWKRSGLLLANTVKKFFYISFSGGKDSTIMSHMIDMAIPGNKIPRVYSNTGIEFNDIVSFVKEMQQTDERIIILPPQTNIKQMLEKEGYPFKSKLHSAYVDRYQRTGKVTSVKQYLGEREDKEPWSTQNSCPNILRYQFTPEFDLRVSDKCCQRMKKDVINRYMKQSGKKYGIVGTRQEEGGNRIRATCIAYKQGKFYLFQPLAPLSNDFMNWYADKFNVKLCKLYYPPFNFKRTGCKGCPFALKLQEELDLLEEYLPAERKTV